MRETRRVTAKTPEEKHPKKKLKKRKKKNSNCFIQESASSLLHETVTDHRSVSDSTGSSAFVQRVTPRLIVLGIKTKTKGNQFNKEMAQKRKCVYVTIILPLASARTCSCGVRPVRVGTLGKGAPLNLA